MQTLFDELPDDDAPLVRAFRQYHSENPHVYQSFRRFAFEAVNAGRRHIGAKLIFERLRWYTNVEARGDPFKLNNNYTAYYARMFMREYPQHEDLFAIRRSQAEAS